MERARFNKRSQKPGESVETFIQDLYRLADNCNYGALRDDLIRDRIVVGVLDDSLSDRLQSKGTLTLTQAVQMSRQAESRAQNRDIVRGDNKSVQVEFVNPGKSGNKKPPSKENSKPTPSRGWYGHLTSDRTDCLVLCSRPSSQTKWRCQTLRRSNSVKQGGPERNPSDAISR